jgi:hypothetical protein
MAPAKVQARRLRDLGVLAALSAGFVLFATYAADACYSVGSWAVGG